MNRMIEEKLEEMEKKTITVNGETWVEEGKTPNNKAYYLFHNGRTYIPKKKELTLDEIWIESMYFIDTPLPSKAVAICKMLAVADYVNEGHGEPKGNWKEFLINYKGVTTNEVGGNKYGFTSFHPDEVERAIKILGEETIKLALS